jgi:hypothetical protein
MCTTRPTPPRLPDRTLRDESSSPRLERLRADLQTITSITRYAAKMIVIVVYLLLAFWLLVFHGLPEGFALLLPWALWSRPTD